MRSALNSLFRRQTRPVILMYHRITDYGADPWGLKVTPANFAMQLEYLSGERTLLDLATFVSKMKARALPRNAIAITFDDGHVDNLHNGEPALAAAGASATLFVASGHVGRPEPFWWDELVQLVLDRRDPINTLIPMGGDSYRLTIPTWEADDSERAGWRACQGPRTSREIAYIEIWKRLRTMLPPAREETLAALRQQAIA